VTHRLFRDGLQRVKTQLSDSGRFLRGLKIV
jgi:hypothetical protein